MHELSAAQNILEIVESNLPADAWRSVKSVKVRIGCLSGIVPESLDFCFTAIAHGTPLEGATLDIERVPFVLHCMSCHKSSGSELGITLCHECGSAKTEVLSGTELQVVEMNVYDDQPESNETIH